MHLMLVLLALLPALVFALLTPDGTALVFPGNTRAPPGASTPVLFAFGPDVVNALCGSVYETQLRVQYTTDDFTISDQCRDFVNWMGGGKSSANVDVVFLCARGEANGTVENEDKLKLMVYIEPGLTGDRATNGLQWLDCRLQGVDPAKGKVVAVDHASFGFSVNDEDGFTISQFTC